MPQPTYTALATVTLGASASSVTFSSIPATYRDLILITDGVISITGSDSLGLRFNSDTGSNYSRVRMFGTGSSTSSDSATLSYADVGVISNANKGVSVIQVMDYSATDKHKTTISRSNGIWAGAWASRWANTSAITSVLVRTESTLSFAAGATFSLYGVIA
jgi:hypothetical protein